MPICEHQAAKSTTGSSNCAGAIKVRTAEYWASNTSGGAMACIFAFWPGAINLVAPGCGAIYLKGCHKPGMPHSGPIGYPKRELRRDWRPVPYTPKTVSIEIRFDRISSQVAGRICETYDADSTGTVMLGHGRPYIYVPELF